MRRNAQVPPGPASPSTRSKRRANGGLSIVVLNASVLATAEDYRQRESHGFSARRGPAVTSPGLVSLYRLRGLILRNCGWAAYGDSRFVEEPEPRRDPS
jgi:hypothetical protein